MFWVFYILLRRNKISFGFNHLHICTFNASIYKCSWGIFSKKNIIKLIVWGGKKVSGSDSSSFSGAGVHSGSDSEAVIRQQHTSIRLIHTPLPRRLNWTRQIKIIHGLEAPSRAVRWNPRRQQPQRQRGRSSSAINSHVWNMCRGSVTGLQR